MVSLSPPYVIYYSFVLYFELSFVRKKPIVAHILRMYTNFSAEHNITTGLRKCHVKTYNVQMSLWLMILNLSSFMQGCQEGKVMKVKFPGRRCLDSPEIQRFF